MKAHVKLMSLLFLASTMVLLSRCDDDDDDNAPATREVQIEITDAASDDENIQGVYITINEIRLDGQSVSGFTRQTIDLTDYQNGVTRVLATATVERKTYNSLTIVTDPATDASGASPGAYVLSSNNTKYPLTGGNEITITSEFEVNGDDNNSILIDFDLRKILARAADPNAGYQWVGTDDLLRGIRVLNKEETGTIRGTYEEEVPSNADLVVVYAYPQGTFNTISETTPSGSSIQFAHATASGAVTTSLSGNNFVIPFLEDRNYELRYAAYNLDGSTGQYTLVSLLRGTATGNGVSNDVIDIQEGQTSDINVSTN